MQFLYNQPLAHRFGVALQSCLRDTTWTQFDAAVAWVRRTGTRHLVPLLRELLGREGAVRFVVGVDIENTSTEGLQDLLDLESFGNSQTHVYHNEFGGTFHPKIYLFSNATDARLIIGSNNLTEAGLFTNTEAGLQAEAKATDKVIVNTRSALTSWADPTQNLAKRLTADLLRELVDEGYILSEITLQKRRRDSEAARKKVAGKKRKQLFGSQTIPRPPVVAGASGPGAGGARSGRRGGNGGSGGGAGGATGTVSVPLPGTLVVRGYRPLTMTNIVLMKIRTARGTQTQIPLQLWRSPYFAGQAHILNHDGARRHLGPTHPTRGGGDENTCKVEMPESEGMTVPVLRLERSEDGVITYHCFDAANSSQGAEILRSLEAGRIQDPPITVLTVRGSPRSSTWYRFI